MTLPIERTRAVDNARDFMRDLLDSGITPRVPKAIREMARRVLKHFPGSYDLSVAAKAAPSTFGQSEGEKYYGEKFDEYRAFRASLYGVRRARVKRSRKSRR